MSDAINNAIEFGTLAQCEIDAAAQFGAVTMNGEQIGSYKKHEAEGWSACVFDADGRAYLSADSLDDLRVCIAHCIA